MMAPALELRQISKRWADGRPALQAVDLCVQPGEFVVLVGPSGCGKSTLLRVIAGLEQADSGELLLHGQPANHTPPDQRGLAMVFQSYALYPHMTVAQNLAFPLKMAGRSKHDIAQRVAEVAQILQIEDLLTRKPAALSGGQRQRVAIGRALTRAPGILLFDEPLSNLDAALREQMRIELARLHQQTGATIIYVTHDQVEAMTLGQRIAVLQGGQIAQCASARELYQQPVNRFVAGFLGTPQMNFAPAALFPWLQPPAGAQELGVRAEHLRLLAPDSEQDGLPVRLAHGEYLGDCCQIYVQHAASQSRFCLRSKDDWQTMPPQGKLVPEAAHCHFFDAAGRRLVSSS
ncbi:ABC transporter ATP-binding protein [Massilia sp. W12]|uniref:ABC transporter ATP-binding protein n=1 Tax=Massilia sp. W12 TaxID=3126507 RepID=UPI0030D12214